ncbi:MAG: hypothetical protein QOD63_2027 [Actinomycetota bacterium]|nr:hypothetical protein [Actinomycetota bacterium]
MMPSAGASTRAVQARGFTALALRTDRVAVEVVGAFQGAGVRAVLLKGAAISTWLYDDGAPRGYNDIDLLVAPDRWPTAEAVLRDLGFDLAIPGTSPLEEAPHARAWARGAEVVDLHHTLWGVGVPPARAWELLSARTQTLPLGGGHVEALDLPARALHVALHAAQNGAGGQKSLRDLARAAERVPVEVWQQAASLACDLHAAGAMAVGLRLHPAAAHLAHKLSLSSRAPVAVTLQSAGAPPFAVGLLIAARAPGVKAKVATAARRLVPTPARMRARYPVAASGWPGMAIAHVVRWASLARQVPASVLAIGRALWSRARSE